MKKMLLIAAVLAAAGCAAYITPEGTYIRPLPAEILIGPPVVVAPPPGIVVSPLPPVVVMPDRRVYYYGGFYYYSWQGGWYWSRERRGPWHQLPRDRWPRRMERHDGSRGRGHRDRGD